MAIINFNSISGVSTISVASSITVGNNVSIGTDSITASRFVGNLSGNVTGTVNSSGIATFTSGIVVSAGSTSAPSISPSGDSNTGIFFPSADTIAFGEGGSEAARFDSNGNLGINTTNPIGNLDIARQGNRLGGNILLGSKMPSTSKWGSVVATQYDSANESEGFDLIHGASSPSSNTVFIGGGLEEVNASTEVIIYTASNTTTRTGTERVRVDSSGRVTIANQPIASLSDSRQNDVSNAVLTSSNFYNTTWVNRGNHFDASTGRFTCPVAGIYRIYVRISQNGNAGKTNIRLRNNGGAINEAYSNNTNDSVSSEAVISCSAGDYLDIQVAELHTIGGSQHKQVTFQLLC